MALEWKDPAPKRWEGIAEELRANPNRWAVIEVPSPSYLTHIKKGKLKAFRPAGAFQLRMSKGETFIRYTGD